MKRTRQARRLIEDLKRTGLEEYSEAARDEAQRLLLAAHLARLSGLGSRAGPPRRP